MELPNKRYKTLLLDPPWDYGKLKERKKGLNGRGGQAQMHYDTMSIDEMKTLPINILTDDDAHLYLWVTNPKIKFAFELIDAWGFDYQTLITWVKIKKDKTVDRGGLGFYFRGATEHILFATKGHAIIPTDKRLPNVIHAERNGHSKKPLESYDLIECVSPTPYLELFAREKREGWDAWGDQVPNHYQKLLTKEDA